MKITTFLILLIVYRVNHLLTTASGAKQMIHVSNVLLDILLMEEFVLPVWRILSSVIFAQILQIVMYVHKDIMLMEVNAFDA